jgi:hypothetical protein
VREREPVLGWMKTSYDGTGERLGRVEAKLDVYLESSLQAAEDPDFLSIFIAVWFRATAVVASAQLQDSPDRLRLRHVQIDQALDVFWCPTELHLRAKLDANAELLEERLYLV